MMNIYERTVEMCVCTNVSIYTYICMYICKEICTYVCMYASCIYIISIHNQIYVRMNVCMYIMYMYRYTYVRLHMYIYIHIYVYIYAHIFILLYIYLIYTYICSIQDPSMCNICIYM